MMLVTFPAADSVHASTSTVSHMEIQLFTFFLSLICVLIFYKILQKKYYEIKNHNHIFLLISVIPLLSPYFRTSAFWGLEENIAYFFFLLAGYFYFKDLAYADK